MKKIKKLTLAVIFLQLCAILIGCSAQNEKIFHAKIKNEESSITYEITVEDGKVIFCESESIFDYKNRNENFFYNHMYAIEKSLGDLNDNVGTHVEMKADEDKFEIMVNATYHFKEIEKGQIKIMFGDDYDSFLNNSNLPSWKKVKKSLEEEGFEITLVQ